MNLPTTAPPLLSADHLSYRLGSREVLREVSLDLYGGEIVGLIGANGAGKSTLLKVLSGVWKGGHGAITLCGKPLTSYRPRQVARLIAQVAQAVTLEAAFSVRDVALMGRNPYLNRFEIESQHDRDIVENALRLTDTLPFAERPITTLSGGERQRVFLARALAQAPSILLLDEPTSNLDVRHQLDILSIVRTLSHEQGIGVLVAIHELSLAAQFCDRLILLDQGIVIAQGTPGDVLTTENLARAFQVAAQPYHDPYTGELKLSIKSTVPVIISSDRRADGVKSVIRKGVR